MVKKKGDKGSPCRNALNEEKNPCDPSIKVEYLTFLKQNFIEFTHLYLSVDTLEIIL